MKLFTVICSSLALAGGAVCVGQYSDGRINTEKSVLQKPADILDGGGQAAAGGIFDSGERINAENSVLQEPAGLLDGGGKAADAGTFDSDERINTENRVLQKTADILAGGGKAASDVICDAAYLSARSENPDVGYCAVALAAFDRGQHISGYGYQLATMYFRDPEKFLGYMQKLPEEAKPPVIAAVRRGAKDVGGSAGWKNEKLLLLVGEN